MRDKSEVVIKDISIIVPAYNEEGSLEKLVIELRETLISLFSSWEIIIVNDASSDNTAVIADELKNRFSNIHVIHNLENKNVGGSYIEGLKVVTKSYVSWLPADGEIPPSILENFTQTFKENSVLVPYPTNSFRQRSFIRAIISKIFRSTVNILFKINLKYQNGSNVYPTHILKNGNFDSNGFLIHLEMLLYSIKIMKCEVSQVPFKLEKRASGDSKALSFKNILDICIGLIILKKKY
ncbi:glycosyltransferase family 2 protein [Halobacteriovorax sp. HLS]|uniref:glycosyltransferase family 2 protein n=1 Tax=Halobacteriovorax sp. HLS TaxID=2234000 RepID=UPI000FD704B0|nr:glycosyltransferase family 2 protein [Halobacteriovorax sp. HLS]